MIAGFHLLVNVEIPGAGAVQNFAQTASALPKVLNFRFLLTIATKIGSEDTYLIKNGCSKWPQNIARLDTGHL
jgi:hypothetical protein